MVTDIANGISQLVRWVIKFAPLGVMGLVFFPPLPPAVCKVLLDYGRLILLLVGVMIFVALVVNPFDLFHLLKAESYPLIFTCLKDSGITAFYRSSRRIPVNMGLCERLGIDKDTYSISIPLKLPPLTWQEQQ